MVLDLKRAYPYNHLIIKDYKHWRIELFDNQCYLGRCIIMYKGDKYDLSELNKEETTELFLLIKKLKKALDNLFSPDKYNYASMGNVLHNLHLHVFPRYNRAVEFGGKIFKDANWGAKPYPYDEPFRLQDSLKRKILRNIRAELTS